MFNNSGYSLADIAAATGGNNNNGFGGDGWWIILLFLFAGWGNNGYGGFGGGGNHVPGYTILRRGRVKRKSEILFKTDGLGV